MQLSTLRYQGYTARITNLSTMEELQDWVSECNITLPQSNLISSIEARFQLEEKKINKGNEVKIEILDDVGNTLYTLQGEANIPKRTKSYTGLEVWEYTIKDSYNRLFEKVVPESQTFYDLYLCNTNDKHNSLLHKIASALGFREEELDFESVAFENGNLIRLPFVYLEENSRWIDKLQAFIEATDGILYIKNKKLFFRPRNLSINHSFSFNRTNIITSLEESEKEVLQNGIRLVYDRYEKLDNQVVFNLQKKIITEPNTNQDTEVPTMKINFITSAVSNPTLTKASGYYFATEDPNSKVDITLEENVHYKKMSWKETGAEVKFYNPLPHKLYVDNFEIKGVPLSMYADNEVSVMFPSVLEKRQENFITASKNKFIQTSEQAKFLAKKAMRRGVVNHAEYQFKTPFLHQIEVGGVYGLDLEDIHTVIEITNLSINLRPGVFRMDIQGISVKEELGNVKITSKLSGNPKESYVDLSSVKEDIQSTKSELVEKYDKKLLSLTEKYDEQLVNISDIHKEELSKITEKLGQLSQGIQDNKVKIYTLKPSYDTLTDLNIGDMYVSDTTVEILIKEGNRYVWKAIKDEDTKKQLESYMQSTNSKLVTISYQFSAPKSPNVGDIWIDTQNDGIWKRWNGSEWEQVDKNVRDTLKKANQDIQKIESSLETVNNTVNRKILAKAFVQEQEPKSGMKEYDVWYKPSTNTYKVYLNWRWNNASEDDIFPALRHYASLENAKLEIGKKIDKTNERAGLFLTNNDQTFGSKYGELAEVSLDKQGAIRLKNANNLLEWNVKDPWSTTKMKSKFYMGVTDVDKVPDNVYFKIGDETNGFSIELKEGERAKAKLDGKELSQKFGEVNDKVQQSKEELDRNINNLAQADSENKRDLEEKLNTAKQEINAQLVNADGKWTALQGWYQETVKDITSFKTQTSESIDTVQGALQQGNFTVTGNTSFDGAARFVSKGTNEVITIADGAIDFHRDGKRLTRIKNIRHGTISTDSKGKGVVDFEGFQQPMVVIPSIKSLNAGKNMASFFCFAEHIERCKYRFFVGVSNEYWKEATPVKVIGTEWSSANTVETTLLGIEGFLSNRSWEFPYRKVYEEEAKKWENWSISTYNSYKDYVEQISPPRFVVRAVRYDNTTRVVLFENSYSVPYTVQPSDTTRNKRIEFTSISLQKTMNVLKHYQVRTNMKYVLELQITKANCDVKIFHRLGTRKHNNKESYYEYRNCREANFNGTIFTLTPSSFVGLAITASASTSTLGEVTGEGEVSYIAMEID